MELSEKISELVKAGFASLNKGDYKGSLRIGRQLKRLRHTSSFEILALAYRGENRIDQAIKELEEGVSKASSLGVLWKLLGDCYSDKRRFEDAEIVYQRALETGNFSPEVIHLNRGIAFNRAAQFESALNALKLVNSARLQMRADACRIRIALQTRDLKSAQNIANSLCKMRKISDANYDSATETEILVTCALAFRNNTRFAKRALVLARKAASLEPDHREALQVFREIIGKRSNELIYYKLIIEGTLGLAEGFFRTAFILDRTAGDAFDKAKTFFPPSIRDSISLSEVDILDPIQEDFLGVYYLSGYMVFPRKRAR